MPALVLCLRYDKNAFVGPFLVRSAASRAEAPVL